MNKIRRITAIITLVVIIGLIIGTIICAVSGSPYFFGMLALSFLVPIILWIFMWFTHLVNGGSKDLSDENMERFNDSDSLNEDIK